MSYSAEILLGRISKINAYNGTITVKLENQFRGKLGEKDPVFIEIDGKPVPFFISSLEDPGGGLIRVRFRHYESYEKIKDFSGCRILIGGKEKGKSPGLIAPGNLEGFRILDTSGTIIGIIKAIISNPAHLIARVITPENTELLIPLHEDLIVRSDPKTKSITMELPDGLAEINK